MAANADLARKLDALEKKDDAQFQVVFDAIRALMAPPAVCWNRYNRHPMNATMSQTPNS